MDLKTLYFHVCSDHLYTTILRKVFKMIWIKLKKLKLLYSLIGLGSIDHKKYNLMKHSYNKQAFHLRYG